MHSERERARGTGTRAQTAQKLAIEIKSSKDLADSIQFDSQQRLYGAANKNNIHIVFGRFVGCFCRFTAVEQERNDENVIYLASIWSGFFLSQFFCIESGKIRANGMITNK